MVTVSTGPYRSTSGTRRSGEVRAGVLWTLGLLAFPLAGIAVAGHVGASGAITVTAVLGLLLHTVLPPSEPTRPPGTAVTAASHTHTNGAPS